ncbi:MAG: hypothetical protein U0R66_05735 [Mycobacterium sp.]
MLKINRTLVAPAAIALACMGGASIGTSAIASANGTVTATGGDGTAVDSDGTQGDFTNSVQGTADDDGYQDARLITSEDAKPQISAAK